MEKRKISNVSLKLLVCIPNLNIPIYGDAK